MVSFDAKSITFVFLFVIVLKANSFKLTKEKVPAWVSLCDEGHQYLFSEDEMDWNSARETCKLLGIISHKMSTITIFGHKRFKQKYVTKILIFGIKFANFEAKND